MKETLFQEIFARVSRGEAAALTVEAEGRRWTRHFLPKTRLILLGGGHVARAVCALAAGLDFAVTVCDDRPAFANSERFPAAAVVCDGFPAAIRGLGLRESDYVCVMTRGHRWDRECLEEIFRGLQPAYLGMVGSHKRTAGIRQSFLDAGVPARRIDALFAPIGLPIGAVTPEEIAVSICAQLIQHRHANAAAKGPEVLTQTLAEPEVLGFLAEGGRPRAMLLVLSATGSTPAKPGALMAVDRFGAAFGTVGGGCSEAAAMAKARRLIGTGTQDVMTVDLTNEDAAQQGMVCGGTLTLLLADVEPAQPPQGGAEEPA